MPRDASLTMGFTRWYWCANGSDEWWTCLWCGKRDVLAALVRGAYDELKPRDVGGLEAGRLWGTGECGRPAAAARLTTSNGSRESSDAARAGRCGRSIVCKDEHRAVWCAGAIEAGRLVVSPEIRGRSEDGGMAKKGLQGVEDVPRSVLDEFRCAGRERRPWFQRQSGSGWQVFGPKQNGSR